MNGNASTSLKGFHFTPTGIAGILKAHRLRVPLYQREYAWEKDQVLQLYNDFSRAKSENSDYFLGTIVTIRGDRNEALEIVDGQQRLTTTAILIAAIRDYMGEIGQEQTVLDSINTDFLSTFERKQRGRLHRLMLNVDDRAFFEALIDGAKPEPVRESHARLVDAMKTANSHVKGLANSFRVTDQPDVFNDWLEFLEHSATVILVETQNGAQAYKMFETLNDRGLKTSQADLVKSYLFGQAGGRITEAQSRWSSMKDNLEEIDDDDRAINFLRHVIIATRSFVRAENVYTFAQGIRGESNALGFLAELERLSRVYVATYRPNSAYWHGYSATAVRALTTFNSFDLKPIRPLVLSLAERFSKEDFATAIKFLVSVSVRLVLTGSTRSGTIEQTFATAALKVYSAEMTDTKALREQLRSVLVADADFHEAFRAARVSRLDLARYYLRTLEAQNANEHEPWFVPNDDPATMTLEHVLPTNATDAKWPGVDEEMKRRLVKRLGNCCILNKSSNNDLGDASFADKQGILADAPYKLTNEIGVQSAWGEHEIDERQARLADLALKAWPL